MVISMLPTGRVWHCNDEFSIIVHVLLLQHFPIHIDGPLNFIHNVSRVMTSWKLAYLE